MDSNWEKELNKIIKELSKWITDFNGNSSLIEDHVFKNYGINGNYIFERTVANYLSNQIEKYLNKKYNVIMLQEFQITPTYIFSKEKIDYAKELSIHQNKIKNWAQLIPDTYIRISDKDNNWLTDVFVEYKINFRFDYIELAIDLLKYRLYTLESETKSNFVFVYFNFKKIKSKFARRLEIISGQPQFLKKDLKEISLVNESTIFIYQNNKSADLNFKIDDFCDFNNQINTLNEYLEEFNFLFDITDNILDEFCDKLFFKDQNKYGTNVVYKANIIRSSFQELQKFYGEIAKGNYKELSLPTDPYIRIDYFNENFNLDVDQYNNFVNESTKHFNNSLNVFFKEDINIAKYNIKKKRGMVIIGYIQAFFETNKINHSLYDTIEKTVPEKKTKDDFKLMVQNIIEVHKNTQSNLNKLALGLIYFICNLYKLCFILNEDGSLIENIPLQLSKSIKKTEKQIRTIFKTIGLEIDVDLKNNKKSIMNEKTFIDFLKKLNLSD